MNLEGKIIGNRYEIIEKIGNGGMATVYKARCTILNRYVAVKVLREEFTTDEEFIKRFNSEAQSAARLTHPNIVSVFDVGQEYNIYYIVMELIQGKTLKQIIAEEGALPWKWSVNIAIQICSALEVAHKNGIVHRDIKPHNIIITEDGIAKVTDFGIAKAVSNSTITAFGTTIGSVHYFSPEHARGGYTDAKSDLYSLGVVMYEMMTGKVPFDADTPVSVALKHMQEEPVEPVILNTRVPSAVNSIILKAMKKDTSFRYASATEMVKDLSLALKNPNGNFVEEKNIQDFTRVIPTISEEMLGEGLHKNEEEKIINQRKTNQENRRKEPPKKGLAKYLEENPHMKKVVYIGLPILIIILCISIFWGSWKITTKLLGIGTEVVTETGIPLPNVAGNTLDEAKQKLDELGVKYEIEEQYSDTIPQGTIIEQDQKPDSKYDAEKTRPVKIIVSKGVKMVKVPKVIGLTFEEAVNELEKYELQAEKIDEANLEVEAGIVTKQDKKENEEIIAGSVIKIHVSTGPEKVTVPSVTDRDVEEAKKILTEAKLEVNVIYKEDTSKSDAVVLKQSIEVGQTVNEGDAITLTVNKIEKIKEGTVNINLKSLTGYKEPEKVVEENKEDKENKDGENAENTQGADKQDKPATQTAQPKNVSVRVKVNEESQYNESHPENTENINVTVSGKGVIQIKVYVDEILKAQKQMDLNSENTILEIK